MSTDYYWRVKRCRACGTGSRMRKVFDLGMQGIICFPKKRMTHPGIEVPKAPLALVRCPKCNLVQLSHSMDRDYLYRDYWYQSGITATMRQHLASVVKEAKEIASVKAGDWVLDIGANDGTLLSLWPEGVKRYAFEPATACIAACQKHAEKMHSTYFDSAMVEPDIRFKAITAISMFYDLDDPLGFLKGVRNVLAPDGVVVIDQNYLPDMLYHNAFDNICHEHVCYHTRKSMYDLAERAGLHVLRHSFMPLNGGSFRLVLKHGKIPWEIWDTPSPVEYKVFAKNVRGIRAAVLNQVKRAKRPYLLGASTRGHTLAQYFGLDHKNIVAASERDRRKHGHVFGATGIPIVSEAEARADADVMIVMPWHFRDEIIERERHYLEAGKALVFPLPKLEVVREPQGVLDARTGRITRRKPERR